VNLQHWQHFLSLEKDFVTTLEFVELHPDNEKTFSVAYTKLLLAVCSEIDVVAKILCKKIDSNSSAGKIFQYCNEITSKYPNFHTVETLIPRYSLAIQPWENWGQSNSPSWWSEYNKVKHERDVNFKMANQKNTLEAICALFCLLLYVYQTELYSGKITPLPILVDYLRMPGHLTVNSGAELPDIPR
jgi:hypothetical protein